MVHTIVRITPCALVVNTCGAPVLCVCLPAFEVWSHNDSTGQTPPATGWQCPVDGPVQEFVLCVPKLAPKEELGNGKEAGKRSAPKTTPEDRPAKRAFHVGDCVLGALQTGRMFLQRQIPEQFVFVRWKSVSQQSLLFAASTGWKGGSKSTGQVLTPTCSCDVSCLSQSPSQALSAT